MVETLVANVSLESYELSTYQRGHQRLHRILVTGPISLKERIALYLETLTLNESSSYFCILDNSAGHENVFTYQDMQFLDTMLLNYGIEFFYGATITTDENYPLLVDVANEAANASGMHCKLLATRNPVEAEAFIANYIDREIEGRTGR